MKKVAMTKIDELLASLYREHTRRDDIIAYAREQELLREDYTLISSEVTEKWKTIHKELIREIAKVRS